MNDATLTELIAAGDDLVGALDQDHIHAIEVAMARFRTAVEAARAQRGSRPAAELKDKVTRAFTITEAARVRINFLADRTRRQLDRLAAAGAGHRVPLAYGRDGRIR